MFRFLDPVSNDIEKDSVRKMGKPTSFDLRGTGQDGPLPDSKIEERKDFDIEIGTSCEL